MSQPQEVHPIIQNLGPSPEQIAPILSRGADLVVTAGAGTGKTRTLVARYLSLLAEGIPLRSIVAITFTKKAAREMRNRIREEVREFLLSEGLSPQQKQVWRGVYEELDGARISTIHSLAGDILRQHPAEMGLDPAFSALEESESARLKAQAVEAALAWAGSDRLASGLFSLFGAWKLRRLLGFLLDKRLDVADALDGAPADLWAVWQPLLLEPLQSFLADPVVGAGLEGLASLKYDGTLDRAQAAGDALAENLRIVIDCWEEISQLSEKGDWIAISRALGLLGKNLKQKGKAQNWEPAKPKAVIKEIQRIYSELIGWDEIDLAVDQRLAQEVVPALRALFLSAEQWYGAARDQLNGLDFDDLESKVLQLLAGHPAVLQYWQRKIQALLVDEYQDTNHRQRQLVNLLNGGDKRLFLVGDGKQSIYRFRGADVAVFRQEQKRVAAAGESYQLDRSYRSHRDLLTGLNILLGPVLGDRDDLPYLEPFAALSPGRESPPRLDLPAYLELHLALGSKTDGAGRRAAEAVASRLLDLIGTGPEADPARGVKFGDVAVLCRASSSFSDFERAFDLAGIPYTTVSGQGFYQRPEIRDVLNALQVFADPAHDLALAGLMRSPVIGLPDQVVLDLRDFQRSQKLASLLESAGLYLENLAEESPPGLSYLLDLVAEFSGLAGRVTSAELISRFLERTSYTAGLIRAGQERAVGNLRKLVLDAQASGIVNLSDFLNSVQELQNAAIREGEAQAVVQGAVQIMSVHQAKGLEFPVVVLGDAAKRERSVREILIDERFGLIPPFQVQYLEESSRTVLSGKSAAYEMALERERSKEQAESRRLLYVGATRAQDLLLVSGAVGSPTRTGKLPSLGGWLGDLAGPLGLDSWEPDLDPQGAGTHHKQIDHYGLRAALTLYESGAAFDLTPGTRAAQKDPQAAAGAEQVWDRINQPIAPRADGERTFKPIHPATKITRTARIPARIIGAVVHRALELWKFPAGGEGDFISWIEAEFKAAGAYQPEATKVGYRRVREILERFCASELYRRMDQSQRLFHEVPFHLSKADGSLHSGSIDALFVENGQWTLVEFKTDRVQPGKDLNWDEVDYLEQVGGYLDAAERILKERPAPVLCFLDYGGSLKLITDRWG